MQREAKVGDTDEDVKESLNEVSTEQGERKREGSRVRVGGLGT